MALLRSRSSLINSSLSHLLRASHPHPPLLRHPSPLAASTSALVRHYNSTSYEQPVKLSNWGVRVVPQQKAYVIERFGKYRKTLVGGLHFMIPLVDRIAYVHSLKEESFSISDQTAITHDNVSLLIDGLVYIRVVDPILASYEVENPILMVRQLAQTTVRSELGKMELDTVFKERDKLNEKIVGVINEAAASWGVKCIRYEIKDITPPPGVLSAMEMQVEAERKKRAKILQAEGEKESNIKGAEGNKQSAILAAQGEARAVLERAQATAEGIRKVSEVMKASGGSEAASLTIAEQYVKAFGSIAKQGTTVLLPSGGDNSASMIAQALSIYKALNGNLSVAGGPSAKLPSASGNDLKVEDPACNVSAPNSSSDPKVKVFSLQSP